MLSLPLKLRRDLVNARLEDFRRKSIGAITSINTDTCQVLDANGHLQGILHSERGDYSLSIVVNLLDAEHQTIGRLEIPNSYGSMLTRLKANIYAGSELSPRYTYTEDSLLLRAAYNLLNMSEHLLSFLQGYLMHPSYTLRKSSGQSIVRLTKKNSMLEGSCRIEPLGAIRPDDKALMVTASLALAQVDYDIISA